MARWGRESDRDRAKEVIHAFLKEKVTQGLVRNREDILSALKEQGLSINREGRDYISVIAPNSGMKMRFRGGLLRQRLDAQSRSGRRIRRKEDWNGAAHGRPSATGF